MKRKNTRNYTYHYNGRRLYALDFIRFIYIPGLFFLTPGCLSLFHDSRVCSVFEKRFVFFLFLVFMKMR